MIEIRNILVPTDFSDFSRLALEHAMAVAGWYGSRIAALHVAPPSRYLRGPIVAPPPGPNAIDRAIEELRHFLEPAKAAGLPVEPIATRDHPTAGILEYAARIPADLLVMGTHGRGGFDRWVLGSVAEKVLRKAPCTVLTVSRPAREATPQPVFRKILCACDFGESSAKALEFALSLAQEADAHLILLHVVEWLPNRSRPLEEMEQEALQQLRESVPESARTFSRPEEAVAVGKPYLEILRVARDAQVELVVQGVQGRNAIDRMFFGSNAHHVVREAPCPVLSVRKT